MSSGTLGGGVLFVLIALLWVAVLAPSFARGREFRAAEQNAARLQRTLRLLAETAAVPEEHHVEAKAREALAYEKQLRLTQKHMEQVRKKELQKLRIEQKTEELRKQKELGRQQAIMRQERLRSVKFKPIRFAAAFLAVAGIVGALVGVGTAISGLGWTVFLYSAVAVGVGLSALILLAPGARKKVHEEVEPVQKHVAVEKAAEKQDVKEDVAIIENMKIDSENTEYKKAQAKAAAEMERARVMAELRAKARAEVKESAVAKENVTDSIMLKKSEAKAEQPKPVKKTGLSAQLENMGVVEESSPTVNVSDLLQKRRNAG